MFSLKTHALISGALFLALIGMAAAGNALIASGAVHDPAALQLPAKIIFLSLFVAFGFSMIPVMVKLVMHAQVQIHGETNPAVTAIVRAQNVIIWILWGLMAAGLAVGLPFAIHDGFMD